MEKRKGRVPRNEYPAIVGDENYPVRHVVLTLDYSRGKATAQKVVDAWLGSKANRQFFKRYYKKEIDKGNRESPVRHKLLLKLLAAWRLFDELGYKAAAEWTKSNRRERVDSLRIRPFFLEKPRQKSGGKYFGGPLFKESLAVESGQKRKRDRFLRKEIEAAG